MMTPEHVTTDDRQVETPFDSGDALSAAAQHLDHLQRRCTEAIDLAKRAQAQVVATQQVLSQHVARMRGLLVQAANERRGVGAK